MHHVSLSTSLCLAAVHWQPSEVSAREELSEYDHRFQELAGQGVRL